MSKTKTPLTIQKGVPMPKTDKRGRPYYYPWRDMVVGDSVDIQADPSTDKGQKVIASARTSVSRFGDANRMKFRALSGPNGLTVWRIE